MGQEMGLLGKTKKTGVNFGKLRFVGWSTYSKFVDLPMENRKKHQQLQALSPYKLSKSERPIPISIWIDHSNSPTFSIYTHTSLDSFVASRRFVSRPIGRDILLPSHCNDSNYVMNHPQWKLMKIGCTPLAMGYCKITSKWLVNR